MFNDYCKNYRASNLPEDYQKYILMDILNMSQPQIDKLDYFEYHAALHYSIMRLRLTTVNSADSKGKKRGRNSNPEIVFNQPADYDYDPNFYSEVGK